MDYENAKQLLLRHGSGTTDADGNPLVANDGFLQMLRPYNGLKEENFHTVLQALYVAGDRVHAQEVLERELAGTLWTICSMSRLLAIDPRGMLQSNQLINEKDTALLESWLRVIESTFQSILSGHPPYFRIHSYAEYIIQRGPWSNIAFFVPHMMRFLDDADLIIDPTSVAKALGCIGAPAGPALPTLHAARERNYPDWCHKEAQSAINAAISQIERGG